MGKFEQYGPIAQQYFVEQQKPISEIAKELNITEKTLHNWKKEWDWEQKKADFLKSKYNCFASLYQLTNMIANDALEAYKADGTKPDKSTISFLSKAIDKLPKMKSIEKQEVLEHTEDTAGRKFSSENINQVVSFLMGE